MKSDSTRPTAHALYKPDELALFEALMSKNMYADHAECQRTLVIKHDAQCQPLAGHQPGQGPGAGRSAMVFLCLVLGTAFHG